MNAVIENNAERFEDLVHDAKSLLSQCKDASLHGMILGIQSVAEQGAASLRAILERAPECNCHSSTSEHHELCVSRSSQASGGVRPCAACGQMACGPDCSGFKSDAAEKP